ncbi:MAG TPA: type II toxin-antitoxin system Phd/YefM family antitoxin [bacterium]|jgi:antitoxin (DNA-binding transcriptional repressor) of toxin-antitoxin stability system|nr:type II toxin-antitoxin system Phd/YefM family antitoxin [bacterium]HOX84784.1 type II toxin-antitoxin system Phd/YefM family antitoxin [bacterium]HPG45507.1 type II toxin-antitoxin system Phd/YefM family antitoxin [bacterium]HPM96717.1 type II toxin-antitoxin system Phd/YefM family antitoxin [bacterium]
MTIYTYSEARQNFASVLDKAKKVGEVLVKRKDGTIFVIKPVTKNDSPLDVQGIDIVLSRDEIVDLLHEVRQR